MPMHYLCRALQEDRDLKDTKASLDSLYISIRCTMKSINYIQVLFISLCRVMKDSKASKDSE